MSPIVGKDYTTNKIMNILNELIKDDSSEVRLNVTQSLTKVADVIGADLLSPVFLSILQNLIKDN